MPIDPLKVSSVLGDPTRLGIYEFVHRASGPVCAQEVAQHFNLHPNVARMHLQKLVDLGLLKAEQERGGRGRPSTVYSQSGHAVTFSFPTRDFQLLSELLSQTIGALGDAAYPILEKVGRDFGHRLAHQQAEAIGIDLRQVSTTELLQRAASVLDSHGIEMAVNDDGHGTVHLVLRGCSFGEVASHHPQLVCHLCQQIVQGVLETQTEVDELRATATLPHGDKCCTFEANVELHNELPVLSEGDIHLQRK